MHILSLHALTKCTNIQFHGVFSQIYGVCFVNFVGYHHYNKKLHHNVHFEINFCFACPTLQDYLIDICK
uniref:Uncharacterized protein n=1 Tax=Arundo donax TaxID=35708 RepID=A0A0A9HMR6_ARUDO